MKNPQIVNRITLMETVFLSVFLDLSNQLLVAKWTGFLKLEQVREGCEFMEKYFLDHHITIHLSEHRDLEILSPEIQEYLIKEWFPKIQKIGVRKVGAVVADDVFAEVTVRNVNSESTTGQLLIEMFSSEEDCIRWLLDPVNKQL